MAVKVDATATNEELGEIFERLRREGAHHEAAEVAFAAAVRSSNPDRTLWQERALEELRHGGTQTLTAVASHNQMIAGVPIPDLLHEGVVIARLNAD